MFSEPFYDPERSCLDNFEHGPFGLFAETTPTSQTSEPKNQFPGQPVLAPGRALSASHHYVSDRLILYHQSLGAPHLDFEMWETTSPMKLLHPVRDLYRAAAEWYLRKRR
jgi:hypothetical protein